MISKISKRWLNKVIPILGGLLFLAAPVYALDFSVDTFTDTTDTNLGDGICSDGANCSLRAAIMEANATVGADTITLPAGTYTLTEIGVDELCENTVIYPAGTACTGSGTDVDPYLPVITADASMGDLDITDDLIIQGAGPDVTTVQWGAVPPMVDDGDPYTGDRIFHIQTTTTSITSVTIQGLTMRNGESGLVPTTAATVATPNAYDIEIVDATAGSVTIWQFRRMGGAIALGAGYGVYLYEETVHGPGGGAIGGGEDGGPFPGGKPGEDDTTSIGEVVLNDVVVVGSWSGADGGGVFGGVPSQISNAIIAGNTSGANGGGLYVAEPTSITDTTIGAITDVTLQRGIAGLDVGNTAENGGGMFDTGSHTTAITRSAINGNTAIGGGGIAGRSIVTINLSNSTLSGNSATDVGGGITTNGTVNLKNVSVVNNSSDSDAPGGGGGLNSFGSGTYNMSNTMLAGNTKDAAAPVSSNCGCSGGSATCPPGIMISSGWNLEDADTCGFTALDLVNTDPMLLALANNGGVSETHNLASTSPAIDAGDINACAVLINLLGNTDQRGAGFARSVDGNGNGTAECDIGALEFVPAAAPPPPGGDNGGLCSYDPNAVFDPVLPGILLISILYLLWNSRRLRTRQCRIDE